MNELKILPMSKLNYDLDSLFIFSSLNAGWTDAFLKRRGLSYSPFGLSENLLAPEKAIEKRLIYWYPSLSKLDEFVLEKFNFDPKSYLCFTNFGNEVSEGDLNLKRETIGRYVELTKIKSVKTVIKLGELSKWYCSFL